MELSLEDFFCFLVISYLLFLSQLIFQSFLMESTAFKRHTKMEQHNWDISCSFDSSNLKIRHSRYPIYCLMFSWAQLMAICLIILSSKYPDYVLPSPSHSNFLSLGLLIKSLLLRKLMNRWMIRDNTHNRSNVKQ